MFSSLSSTCRIQDVVADGVDLGATHVNYSGTEPAFLCAAVLQLCVRGICPHKCPFDEEHWRFCWTTYEPGSNSGNKTKKHHKRFMLNVKGAPEARHQPKDSVSDEYKRLKIALLFSSGRGEWTEADSDWQGPLQGPAGWHVPWSTGVGFS